MPRPLQTFSPPLGTIKLVAHLLATIVGGIPERQKLTGSFTEAIDPSNHWSNQRAPNSVRGGKAMPIVQSTVFIFPLASLCQHITEI